MRLYLATALLALHSAYGQNGEMDRFNRKARPMHSDGKEEEHDETYIARPTSFMVSMCSIGCLCAFLSAVHFLRGVQDGGERGVASRRRSPRSQRRPKVKESRHDEDELYQCLADTSIPGACFVLTNLPNPVSDSFLNLHLPLCFFNLSSYLMLHI
jgi:hypothetical protein